LERFDFDRVGKLVGLAGSQISLAKNCVFETWKISLIHGSAIISAISCVAVTVGL